MNNLQKAKEIFSLILLVMVLVLLIGLVKEQCKEKENRKVYTECVNSVDKVYKENHDTLCLDLYKTTTCNLEMIYELALQTHKTMGLVECEAKREIRK